MTCRGEFDHDYSLPPHNTPDSPRDGTGGDCQAQVAAGPPWCTHEQRYAVTIYQIGTHDWVRLMVCPPCCATLRRTARRFGPGGTNGVWRVTDAA